MDFELYMSSTNESEAPKIIGLSYYYWKSLKNQMDRFL